MRSRAGVASVGLMALVLALFPADCSTAEEGGQHCTPSCGDIHIRHPFRLGDDPPKCGDHKYELACENNRTTLNLALWKFFVQEISYDNKAMRVVDASLYENDRSLPFISLTNSSLSCLNPYALRPLSHAVFIMDCKKPVNSPLFVDVTPCINVSSCPKIYSYAFYGHLLASDIPESCSIETLLPALFSDTRCLSIFEIHSQLLTGFDLLYGSDHLCSPSGIIKKIKEIFQAVIYTFWYLLILDSRPFRSMNYIYYYDWLWYAVAQVLSFIVRGFVVGRTLGILALIAFFIYKFRRRHLSVDDAIEEFLQNHNNFMPIKYSYSQIKEITKGFKHKLGHGGYGYVYKGKLRSGHLVAVKVLHKSKANGQDFINEVATIGMIHHVNVVRLTGFCVEGSKWALIYEFMANGSLDKFLFHKELINPLSWERTYEIGLGVARGIEYLHRGCDMQILHFDIKPHNILLDENFIPKISDFGLAKLYPIDDSIVSLTAARGTPGYIAPELFYKNIGGISYKADVYSFGMLLMEMVGKRKNVNAFAEHSSQIYFPSWVYERISQGEDIELGDANEVERQFARKMIIVALWCTQMKPVDRPSMSEVLEMLEGEVELLQMPQKPLLNPQGNLFVDHADNNINPNGAPFSSDNHIGTITLDGR